MLLLPYPRLGFGSRHKVSEHDWLGGRLNCLYSVGRIFLQNNAIGFVQLGHPANMPPEQAGLPARTTALFKLAHYPGPVLRLSPSQVDFVWAIETVNMNSCCPLTSDEASTSGRIVRSIIPCLRRGTAKLDCRLMPVSRHARINRSADPAVGALRDAYFCPNQ